jgi:hypothetical protein
MHLASSSAKKPVWLHWVSVSVVVTKRLPPMFSFTTFHRLQNYLGPVWAKIQKKNNDCTVTI